MSDDLLHLKPMKKPSWFRWLDLLFPGSLWVVSGVLTVLTFRYGTTLEGEPLTLGPKLMMIGLTLAFLGIYLVLLYLRKKALDKFVFIDARGYGLMVHTGGWKEFDRVEFKEVTDATFVAWGEVLGVQVTKLYLNSDNIYWAWFEPGPIETPTKQKVAGYTIPRSNRVHVGYKTPDQPLTKTAYEHELGHIIQGWVTGSWDETEHHERAKKYGLK